MKPENVRTREDLASFIQFLANDAEVNLESWSYSFISGYLEILAALVARGAERGNSDREPLTYSDWAEILSDARYME